MRAVLYVMVGLVISVPSQAATLEQVVQVMALPAQATAAAPSWPALNWLGLKWQHAGLNQSTFGYTKSGSVQLDSLGKISVSFQGSRSEPHTASLYLPPAKAIDKTEFGAALKRLLPTAQIKQVREGCKDEGIVGGSAVFQIDLSGKRPAYVLMMSGTSKAGLDTSMDIAAQLSKDWNCET